jgi:hypothetical protein
LQAVQRTDQRASCVGSKPGLLKCDAKHHHARDQHQYFRTKPLISLVRGDHPDQDEQHGPAKGGRRNRYEVESGNCYNAQKYGARCNGFPGHQSVAFGEQVGRAELQMMTIGLVTVDFR